MDGHVIFCADGVLRFQSDYDSKRLLPLVAVQEVLEYSPSKTFLQTLRRKATIEKGSTLGSFLMCIAPWASEAQDFTDRNVQAYITELRKPSGETNAFDRIEIRQRTYVRRSMVHDPIPAGVDIFDWLNRDREIKWSNNWDVESDYDICGYTNGDPSNYSVSTNIHSIKNVPLVFNKNSVLVEGQPKMIPHTPLFNPSAEGVWEVGEHNMLAVNSATEETASFLDLLNTVISHGLWYNTPQGFIATRDRLIAAQEQVDEMIAEAAEDTPSLSLVDDDYESPADSEAPAIKKVVVVPGAFDGIIEHSRSEGEEWELMVEAVSLTTQHVVRIGEVEEDTAPDNRLFGSILP